jgi:large subunit ribosomal protein L2
MGVRYFKPTTPGRRGASVSDFADLTRDAPEKGLTTALRGSGGRNNHGRVTSRHRGGFHRRRYRLIDFKREKDGVPGKVAAIEYDPARTCRIALIHYADGEKRYILAPKDLAVGARILSGPAADPEVGNCLPLAQMPLGTIVHNVELSPGCGGQLARAAGTFVRFMAREGRYALLVLPSGETRKVHVNCRATVGQVGNEEQQHVIIGKAGRNRWRGYRPHVRGMAMNPCDHPMGGGSGRRKGRHPQSPTGVLAKGGKTRKRRSPTNRFIVRRRPNKRIAP